MYYDNAGSPTRQENQLGVWDSNFGMVHHLNSTGTGSGDFVDATHNHNGTQVESPLQGVASKVGDGIDTITTGSQDEGVLVGNTIGNLFGNDHDFTISMWLEPDNHLANNRNAFGNYDNTGDWFLFRTTGTSGTMNFLPAVGSGLSSSSTLGSGWNYITLTFDGTVGGGTYQWYRNGATMGSSGSGDHPNAPNKNTYIGRLITGGSSFGWDGGIDEVRVSDNVRSADWIFTEYANMNAPNTFATLTVEELPGIEVTDTPSITDSAIVSANLVPSDVPSITDGATVSANLVPSDAPSITDSAIVSANLVPSDAPSITDSATVSADLFPLMHQV
jgi:hypothetical protein